MWEPCEKTVWLPPFYRWGNMETELRNLPEITQILSTVHIQTQAHLLPRKKKKIHMLSSWPWFHWFLHKTKSKTQLLSTLTQFRVGCLFLPVKGRAGSQNEEGTDSEKHRWGLMLEPGSAGPPGHIPFTRWGPTVAACSAELGPNGGVHPC